LFAKSNEVSFFFAERMTEGVKVSISPAEAYPFEGVTRVLTAVALVCPAGCNGDPGSIVGGV